MDIKEIRQNKSELYDLVCYGEDTALLEFVDRHPEIVFAYDDPPSTYEEHPGRESILCEAVAADISCTRLKFLLLNQAQINSVDTNGWTGLCRAVARGRIDFVEILLGAGADPNIGNPLRSCNFPDVKDPIAMAKLLLDHGADINAMDEVASGDMVTTLDWVDSNKELAAYLKSRGAKYAAEILGHPQPDTTKVDSFRGSVIKYFKKHVGEVTSMSLGMIVPDGAGIELHWVPAGAKRGLFGKNEHHFVFTTGLSKYAMPVPFGGDDYKYAELLIVLPAEWPTPDKAILDPKTAWPIHWLRRMASYPIENKAWLGWPVTIIPNDLPPQPLGPDCPFTAWMLAAGVEKGESVICKGGDVIQIYKAYPLYTEEYQLERDRRTGSPYRRF